MPNRALLEALNAVTPDSSLALLKPQAATTRMGKILSRLRFEPRRENGGGRQRGWWIGIDAVRNAARAYGVPTSV